MLVPLLELELLLALLVVPSVEPLLMALAEPLDSAELLDSVEPLDSIPLPSVILESLPTAAELLDSVVPVLLDSVVPELPVSVAQELLDSVVLELAASVALALLASATLLPSEAASEVAARRLPRPDRTRSAVPSTPDLAPSSEAPRPSSAPLLPQSSK